MKVIDSNRQLIKSNNEGIFNKLKRYFNKLFNKDYNKEKEIKEITEVGINTLNKDKELKFLKSVKNIQDKELLELQNQYHIGKIKTEDLTDKQILALCELYDRQIADLEKSNKMRKNKLLKYRENMKKT